MPKRSTIKQKLAALKKGHELPVNLNAMSPGDYADTDERSVLALARSYQHAEDPEYASVSWTNQEKATRYFNEHGLIETLNECLRVGGPDALN